MINYFEENEGNENNEKPPKANEPKPGKSATPTETQEEIIKPGTKKERNPKKM